MQVTSRIWGSHRDAYENLYLLGYNAVYSVEGHSTFRRSISNPSSGPRDSTCHLLSRSHLSWIILQPWRWRRRAPPKRPLTFKGLHFHISQNIEIFTQVVFLFLSRSLYCVWRKNRCEIHAGAPLDLKDNLYYSLSYRMKKIGLLVRWANRAVFKRLIPFQFKMHEFSNKYYHVSWKWCKCKSALLYDVSEIIKAHSHNLHVLITPRLQALQLHRYVANIAARETTFAGMYVDRLYPLRNDRLNRTNYLPFWGKYKVVPLLNY